MADFTALVTPELIKPNAKSSNEFFRQIQDHFNSTELSTQNLKNRRRGDIANRRITKGKQRDKIGHLSF